MQQVLGADNDAVKAALAGMSPEARAKEVIEGTQLQDVAFRKQLYEGGKAAVDASNDPLIVMMRTVDPYARAVRKRYDDEVDPVLAQECRQHREVAIRPGWASAFLRMPPSRFA